MTSMTLDSMFGVPVSTAIRRPRSSMRLTRRGRVVVLLVALVMAFAVGVFVTAASSVATLEGDPAPTRIVQVGSGDTLWDIAAGLATDGEVRPMMERIQRLNALDSTTLQAGQRLVVPAAASS